MLYDTEVLDHHIDVDASLQLPQQLTPDADKEYLTMQCAIIRDVERIKDVLPILNNHFILESIVMESMAPLSDTPANRLIPVAYLYAFTRFNHHIEEANDGKFNEDYLRNLGLYSYVIKLLHQTGYTGREYFLKVYSRLKTLVSLAIS
jgi:hypothetical protein